METRGLREPRAGGVPRPVPEGGQLRRLSVGRPGLRADRDRTQGRVCFARRIAAAGRIRMSNFDDYFNDLADWEQNPVLPLIAPWNANDVQAIVSEFRAAFEACSFAATLLAVPPGT